MLTDRQREVLNLIVQLYGQLGQPIGSNTLLKESLLTVSPATIRNDMVALEKQGYVTKAHSSSGRYPSIDGLRYYVDYLTHKDLKQMLQPHDKQTLKQYFQSPWQTAEQKGRMAVELLASLVDYPVFVYGPTGKYPKLQEIALTYIDETHVIVTLLMESGEVESQLLPLNFTINPDQADRVSHLLQQELSELPLNEVFQRMRLTIPLLIQQVINYQIDFTPLIDKTRHHLKGYYYFVTNKVNLFDFVDVSVKISALKELFNLLEGSNQMLQLLDQSKEGIELLSSQQIIPSSGLDIHMITATYSLNGQRQTLGLVGPSTMPYQRIVKTLLGIMQELSHIS